MKNFGEEKKSYSRDSRYKTKGLLGLLLILVGVFLSGMGWGQSSWPKLDTVWRQSESVVNGAPVGKVSNQVYTITEAALKTAIAEKEKILSELIVLPDNDTYDKLEANAMIQRILNIDVELLKAINDGEMKIYLWDKPITTIPSLSYLKGVTPRGWEGTGKTWDDIPGVSEKITVARIGYSDPGEFHGSINLELHEIGHSIDFFAGERPFSESQAFRSIWKKESIQLFPDSQYTQGYIEEYFAETFAMYYLNKESRELLKEIAPETHLFMGQLKDKVK